MQTDWKNIPQEKNWLIRSSMKIMGPFSLQEVTQLLAARQISLIDEVRVPDRRWTYIRENPIFLDLVKVVRAQQDGNVEKTVASNTATQSTQKIGVTKTDWIFTDDKTPAPQPLEETQASIKDIEPLSEIKVSNSKGPLNSDAKAYGVENDMRWAARRKQFRRRLQLAFVAVIVVLVSGIYMRQMIKNNEKQASLARIEKLAHLHFTQGLAQKALSGFQKVLNFRDLNEIYKFDYGVLLINSGSVIEGRRILEKQLNSTGLSRERTVEILNSLGVSYLNEGNPTKAEEMFAKAVVSDGNNLSSRLNMLQIKLLKRQYSEIFEETSELMKRWPQDLDIRLIRNLAAIGTFGTGTPIVTLTLEDENKTLLGKRHYLSQQLGLTFFHMLVLSLGFNEETEKAGWVFLNSFPLQRENFAVNYTLSNSSMKWQGILDQCKSIHSQNPDLTLTKLILSYCLIEAGSEDEAQKYVDQVLSTEPRHDMATVLQSLIYIRSGKIGEALANLDTVSNSGTLAAQYVRLLACSQQTVGNCAGDAARVIYKSRPSDSIALYYVAQDLFTNGQRKQAWDLVSKGLSIDPNYVPLIELRSQLEGALD